MSSPSTSVDPSTSTAAGQTSDRSVSGSIPSNLHLDKCLALESHRSLLHTITPTLSSALYISCRSPSSPSLRNTAFPLPPDLLPVPRWTIGDEISAILDREKADDDGGATDEEVILEAVTSLNRMLRRLGEVGSVTGGGRKRKRRTKSCDEQAGEGEGTESEGDEGAGEAEDDGEPNDNDNTNVLSETPGRKGKRKPLLKRWDDVLLALSGTIPKQVLWRSLQRLERQFEPVEEQKRRLVLIEQEK
ncbi:hypothetical protein BT69DRAFT_1330269 [Atractiella rhizophila]|nr:hypothetical protein BT69DRAFT_1330269 [Atractiella rhizophila]